MDRVFCDSISSRHPVYGSTPRLARACGWTLYRLHRVGLYWSHVGGWMAGQAGGGLGEGRTENASPSSASRYAQWLAGDRSMMMLCSTWESHPPYSIWAALFFCRNETLHLSERTLLTKPTMSSWPSSVRSSGADSRPPGPLTDCRHSSIS